MRLRAALLSALDVIRPQGWLIQFELGGDVSILQNVLVAKEIELCGSFRFDEEFAWAVELIGSNCLPLAPLLTSVYPVSEAVSAFEAARNREKHMKVMCSTSPDGQGAPCPMSFRFRCFPVR